MRRTLLVLWVGSTLGVACGGASQKAEEPDAESAAESKAEGSKDQDSEEAGDDADDAAESGDDAAGGSGVGGMSPVDVLLKEDAVFMLDFKKSDVGKKQEEACDQRAGDDPAKKANCMSAAMKKVNREGFLFEEDDEGQLWFVRVSVEGGKKVVYNQVKAELGEPSGKSVTVKTSGRDQAARRKGSVPGEFTINVPDEYTATIDDASKGKMVYELRLSLFEDQAQ